MRKLWRGDWDKKVFIFFRMSVLVCEITQKIYPTLLLKAKVPATTVASLNRSIAKTERWLRESSILGQARKISCLLDYLFGN